MGLDSGHRLVDNNLRTSFEFTNVKLFVRNLLRIDLHLAVNCPSPDFPPTFTQPSLDLNLTNLMPDHLTLI